MQSKLHDQIHLKRQNKNSTFEGPSHFDTRHLCLFPFHFFSLFISVFVLDICSLPPITGVCRAYFPRYFYNTTSERCEEFVYGGCRGNKNNFVKKVNCKLQCDDPGEKLISFVIMNFFTAFNHVASCLYFVLAALWPYQTLHFHIQEEVDSFNTTFPGILHRTMSS